MYLDYDQACVGGGNVLIICARDIGEYVLVKVHFIQLMDCKIERKKSINC